MATVKPSRFRGFVPDGAPVLELGAPRLEELREDLQTVDPGPTGTQDEERSVGRALAILFPLLALLIAAEIALAFLVAYLVTGRAY
jgi:hypothetical protein